MHHRSDMIHQPYSGSLSDLEGPFSEKEIWDAIWQLGGRQGLGTGWVFDILLLVILGDSQSGHYGHVDELFHHRLDQDRQNYAKIILIPKKNDLSCINDFRLISLLNGSFKIIMKVLANKLSAVLNDLINPEQSGFIRSRHIFDSVATAQEVMFRNKVNKEHGFILRLDFKKTYDSVA